MVLDYPQIQIFSGSTLLGMNCFCLGPLGEGTWSLCCFLHTFHLLIYSLFHPTPSPLRYLAHPVPEHFLNLAVQNNLLFVDSYPYKLHYYFNAVPSQLQFVYSLLSFHSVLDISSPMSSPLSFFLSYRF